MSAAIPVTALAQSADELKNDDKTPGDVLTYGMGYSQHRFSPLTQINRQTVKRLVPAWSYSLADNGDSRAKPWSRTAWSFLPTTRRRWPSTR